jgi:hypothetical protein
VGGTTVGGGPGDAVLTFATGFGVAVPSTVTFTLLGRFKK